MADRDDPPLHPARWGRADHDDVCHFFAALDVELNGVRHAVCGTSVDLGILALFDAPNGMICMACAVEVASALPEPREAELF